LRGKPSECCGDLGDQHVVVREIAAWLLGERRRKEALPYLEKTLYDESEFVRTGVLIALYKIFEGKK